MGVKKMKKRVLAFLVVIMFVFSSFTSFAAVDKNVVKQLMGKITAEQAVKIVLKNETPSQQNNNFLTEIEGMNDIVSKQAAIINELSKKEISNSTAVSVVDSVYNLQCLRNMYFKKVLLKMNEIKTIENKTLAKQAVSDFEIMIAKQSVLDKVIQEKIEGINEFLTKIESFKVKRSQSFWKSYYKILKNYYAQRKAIVYINNSLKDMKKDSDKAALAKLQSYAQEMEKVKKYDVSFALYQEGLKIAEDKKPLFKKISQIFKKQGNKSVLIFVEDRRVVGKINPIIKNGSTMVPLRVISEGLKAEVKWDEKNNTVVITKGEKTILVPIGSKKIKLGEKEIEIREPAVEIRGTTLVPIRAISEILNASVGWYDAEQTVTVNDNFNTEKGSIKNEELSETNMFTDKFAKDYINNLTEDQVIQDILSDN